MIKLALHWKIIAGLVLGVIWGLFANYAGLTKFTANWIAPFGTIFINLLKLIAVPLVVTSLITGISSLKDISMLSRMGSKTIIMYLISTFVAVTIGLTIVNIIKPGHSFSPEKREEFKQLYAPLVTESAITAERLKGEGPLQPFVDIVPQNIFFSLQDNTKMLQVIFFSIFFGIALAMISGEKTLIVKDFFRGINEAVLKMVDLVMRIAPYGVFALLAALVAGFTGNMMELFTALGLYSLTVLSGLAIMVFVIYPIILRLLTKIKVINFFRAVAPAQMLAFSTSSSAATLPVTMEVCEKELGISREVTGFVLPLGATINMDGTSLYQAVAAVFIAQAFGYNLTISQQFMIVLMTVLASIGAAPIPGAGMVMLIIILQSIGIHPGGLSLIFATDRILDMCRTVVNVTGDSVIASIVATGEKHITLSHWQYGSDVTSTISGNEHIK
ncbi:MAG: dicarboxylate/amino acid:cation symporter [Candidatus Loosdrechtia sp.]|uniref:dicarboxylate/amino acid:cation symporter n=1 Tax=Candidatus Loosdrechtia sp. TaxID=3101272 RepID=UPI003A6A030B|nr:MAG: dicarboxylate/amino acid:cation symporter [Candidatus Jettenia sp. AMX2]